MFVVFINFLRCEVVGQVFAPTLLTLKLPRCRPTALLLHRKPRATNQPNAVVGDDFDFVVAYLSDVLGLDFHNDLTFGIGNQVMMD